MGVGCKNRAPLCRIQMLQKNGKIELTVKLVKKFNKTCPFY